MDTLYSLNAELLNFDGKTSDRQFFERTLNVRFLRETGHDSLSYDPELKIHFKNPLAIASIYEIETVDFFVTASKRLQKAEEFIRRINYKYDRIQIKADAKGKVRSIENKDELKKRWLRLRQAILKDYKGDVAEYALKKTDKQFGTEDDISSAIFQYFYFGLLFPHIPKKHPDDWENKRMIKFSEYEGEKFEEQTVYDRLEDDLRMYKVSGAALPESHTTVDKYEGYIAVTKDDIFPENAKVNITFRRENITNQWSFKLLRYN